ncbi:MAG: bifunctional phosphoglucose/phosphomannose isomerase [Candidatus Eremiobacteraeota bacterium]|nr:bifunctional phosphoglucose/phosphomannose isomerase [Candidatus Eremiobacteraeota bacterium]MBC5826260.1 bifunctional phosphoglucose/phosphomannose isomerase [Candidatus Eremiobacteraeota bacterium]
MFGAILGLPEQCEEAKRIALAADLGALTGRRFTSVVLAGLGGSAIGGDFLRSTYETHLACPMTVIRDYTLPSYVGPDTLVLASSNSGNTEETLSAYEQARKAKAPILALTTGGKLADLAGRDGVPVVKFPAGLQPRAAVGYAFVPLVVVAARLGLMSESLIDDIDEAAAVLKGIRNDCNSDVPESGNHARRLASVWVGKIPVIYGSQAERGVVAYRWKTQINENAKAYAFANVFPELNHNETVGWSGDHGQGEPQSLLSVVVLRDDREPKHIAKRVQLTKEIIRKHAAGIDEVWSRGESALARMLSLVYVGDFASCYLAYAYGEDPTPVKVIDWLKAELAKV